MNGSAIVTVSSASMCHTGSAADKGGLKAGDVISRKTYKAMRKSLLHAFGLSASPTTPAATWRRSLPI